jgi:hypothetical protein
VDDELALDDAFCLVKPPVGADLAVELVTAPELAAWLPVGVALAEFRTKCLLPVSYDQ